jgi:hypothetical protein
VNPVFLRAAKKKHLEVVEYLLPFILPMGSPTTESSRPQEEEVSTIINMHKE